MRAVDNVNRISISLFERVHESLHPEWLGTVMDLSDRSSGSFGYGGINEFVVHWFSDVSKFNWHDRLMVKKEIDFDEIFYRCKAESRLPELFDEVIGLLDKIKKSDEIDKLSVISGLDKVTASLKENKEGSFLSFKSSWQFFKCFAINYLQGELSGLPSLAAMGAALLKAIDEADLEFKSLSENMNTDLDAQISSTMGRLPNINSRNILGYDGAGASLSDVPSNSVDEQA